MMAMVMVFGVVGGNPWASFVVLRLSLAIDSDGCTFRRSWTAGVGIRTNAFPVQVGRPYYGLRRQLRKIDFHAEFHVARPTDGMEGRKSENGIPPFR